MQLPQYVYFVTSVLEGRFLLPASPFLYFQHAWEKVFIKEKSSSRCEFQFGTCVFISEKRLLVLYSMILTPDKLQQLLGVQKVHNYSRRQLIFCTRYTLSISKFDEFATTKTEKLANCNYWFTGSSAFIFLLHFLNLLTYLRHAKKYLVLFW